MASLRGQLVALEGELETSHRGEGQLQAQLEHLNQVRERGGRLLMNCWRITNQENLSTCNCLQGM